MSDLSHAGVKGMKWGVRKDRNVSNKTNSKKLDPDTKRKIKTAAIIGGSVIAAGLLTYGGYKLSQNQAVRDLGEDLLYKYKTKITTAPEGSAFRPKDPKTLRDSIIPKNSVFSTIGDNDSLDRSRTFYATLSGPDKDIYRSRFAREVLARHGTSKIYSNGTINTKDLKVAGKRTTEALYKEFTKNPDANVMSWHYSRPGVSDKSGHDKFLAYLKTQGYSAMVDQMDVGYGGAKNPLIIFGDNDYVSTGSHLVESMFYRMRQ